MIADTDAYFLLPFSFEDVGKRETNRKLDNCDNLFTTVRGENITVFSYVRSHWNFEFKIKYFLDYFLDFSAVARQLLVHIFTQ